MSSLALSHDELCEIVDSVTAAFLQQHSTESAADTCAPEDCTEWTGEVSLTGPVSGSVTLTCSRSFAMRAARAMFGEACSGDDADARDALAELTNVIGGNIKSLFSMAAEDTCHLSLPGVSARPGAALKTKLLSEVWVECSTERIRVCVYQDSL